jgi:hypothetical protein
MIKEWPRGRRLLVSLGVWTRLRTDCQLKEGTTMRIITILAAGVALAFASTGVQAQSTQAPSQPPAAAPEATPQPAIKSVTVIDIEELPEDTQKQVNDVVTKGGDEQLQRLRASVDGMPELKSALEAKGLSSAQVIAASMGEDGALTLITKKAG